MNIKVANNVVSRNRDVGALLHNTKLDIRVTLNDVASDIWKYVKTKETSTLEEIVCYIKNEYSIDEFVDVRSDIVDIIKYLHEYGFIDINGESKSTVHSMDRLLTKKSGSLKYDAEHQLEDVTLEVTYSCNERCVHCYVDNSDKQRSILSLEEYKAMFVDMVNTGILYMSFTGGDPFVRKDFIDIYQYAALLGFAIDIYTNGLLIGEKELNILSQYRPRRVYISVYSLDDIHDSITGINGSLKKTINTIEKLIGINVKVILNVPVMALNMHSIIKIIDWANEKQIDYKVSFQTTPKSNGDMSTVSLQCFDDIAIKSILEKINYVPDEEPHARDYICGAGLRSLTINPFGDVRPCVGLSIKVGSILESKIDDIWSNSINLEEIRNATWDSSCDCRECSAKKYCNHCMGVSHFETGNIRSKNTTDCYLAKLKESYCSQI